MRLAAIALAVVCFAAPPARAGGVVIAAVYFDTVKAGDPEEAVELVNTGSSRADVSGYRIADRAGGGVTLPAGATLEAGARWWVARDGVAFTQQFGIVPAFDAVPGGPVADVSGTWAALANGGDEVFLRDAGGALVDAVVYGGSTYAGPGWTGPPAQLDPHFSPTGQILERDRLEDGSGIAADTDGAGDFDDCRVYYVGQSHVAGKRLEAQGPIVAGAAPDNAWALLSAELDAATTSIHLATYTADHPLLRDRLIAASQRGVKVKLLLEGSPVGGIADQERWFAQGIEDQGGEVWFLVSDAAREVRARYTYHHAKYVVIDGAAVVVGSENFGRAGYPADPTYGNRGFMVAVHDRDVALAFEAVWADDTNPAHPDLKRWSAADPVLGAPPAGFVPDLSVAGGSHTPVGPPLTIAGPVTVEPVWSPDTSCMQASGPLALVRSATASIDLQTMVLQTWWGSTVDTPASAPDLLLEELVQAARRGVRVRVLLDSNPVNMTTADRRDNDDTVTYLAAAALREGIPIEARPINRPVVGIGWLHNKSMIVDGARTLIASINGSETSFRVNREAGVILDAPAIAAWYGGIFASDWDAGRGGRLARPGDVVFSEVAWAGTLAGAGDEWLELHNNLCVPVNLSGWTVSRNDASSVWTLTGTLPASGDYLVEGREAATSVVSDRVAPLLLANAGDRLELFDGAGTSVDLVNPASGPWPAGDAVARASMERVDPCAPGADPANWRTASGGSGALDAALNPIAGTPGAANSVSRPTCLACLAAELPEVHLVGVLKRSGGARELTWTDVSAVPAFSHYHLYRATVKGSEAAFVRIGGEIAGPGYVDADPGDAFLYVPVAVSTIEKEGPSGVFDGEFDR